jgi:hypothetical protein
VTSFLRKSWENGVRSLIKSSEAKAFTDFDWHSFQIFRFSSLDVALNRWVTIITTMTKLSTNLNIDRASKSGGEPAQIVPSGVVLTVTLNDDIAANR